LTREVLFTLKAPYRDPLEITGFRFGKGEKACCIVGAVRGNEIQQQYVCSQLVRALRSLEGHGQIAQDNEILVIPSAGAGYSMNTGNRFWAVDHTDINRMFPGYDGGETTQRIADGIFRHVGDYSYGVQFASFYMPGDFVPHVRMMETGYQSTSLANLFGLPYVVIRPPRPYDTATLNYNWQLWHTNAFSVYTAATDQIDEPSARQAVDSVLRFLNRVGLVRYHCHNGYIASVIREDELVSVLSPTGGVYLSRKAPGSEVTRGETLAEITDPYTGESLARIPSPADGIIFFAYHQPLVMEHAVIYKIIKHAHGY